MRGLTLRKIGAVEGVNKGWPRSMTRPPGQLSERDPEPPKRPILPLWGILALLLVAMVGVVLVLSR